MDISVSICPVGNVAARRGVVPVLIRYYRMYLAGRGGDGKGYVTEGPAVLCLLCEVKVTTLYLFIAGVGQVVTFVGGVPCVKVAANGTICLKGEMHYLYLVIYKISRRRLSLLDGDGADGKKIISIRIRIQVRT